MPLAPDLNQIQVGKQTDFTTAITPTVLMPKIESMEMSPEIEVEEVKEVGRGSLAGNFNADLNSHKGMVSIAGLATYEDIQYWLDSINGLVSPSGTNPYVYAGVAPLTAKPTRRIQTIVWGQTGIIYKLTGGICNDLTITVENNKSWRYKAGVFGQKVDGGALASLSHRTVVPIHANVTSLYIDAWGGTMGATAITNPVFFSYELNIKSNSDAVMGIGSLYPTTYKDQGYSATLKLHLEAHSETAAYITSILGSSVLQHQVRLKGTTGASAIAQLDFAGSISKAPKIFSDKDGVVTFEFEYFRTYHATFANWFKSSVTNAVATLA